MRDRLEKFIKSEGLTPTRFAEVMGVQPSSISHLLGGRNKPSYDFIEKMLLRFPKLNPDWLILGKGSVYRWQEAPEQRSTAEAQNQNINESFPDIKKQHAISKQSDGELFFPPSSDIHPGAPLTTVDPERAPSLETIKGQASFPAPQNVDRAGATGEQLWTERPKSKIEHAEQQNSSNAIPVSRSVEQKNISAQPAENRLYETFSDASSENAPQEGITTEKTTRSSLKNKIERVIVFYSDKTFVSYEQQ